MTVETAPPGRARGRELALWMLSHLESAAPGSEREAVELFLREPPELDPGDEFLAPHAGEIGSLIGDRVARRWATRLIDAYLHDARSIDAEIEAASQRWRLERMDRVDRNLLRLCAVELRDESTPRNVVVAEAVRLAARYGSERSPSFVNGLAEALARTLRDTRTQADAGPDAESSGSEEEVG
jgi:N utilization substance protein B